MWRRTDVPSTGPFAVVRKSGSNGDIMPCTGRTPATSLGGTIMPKVLVTGFRPFSPLTWLTGNPSQVVAERLGERYPSDAQVEILDAAPTCLTRLESLGKNQALNGVLMVGTQVQIAPVMLELEGVSTADGLLGALKTKIASTAARDLEDYARSIGVPSSTAPITPLVYWCLRSYAAALEWAEPRKVPCIFLHVNTLRLSPENQVQTASRFFEKIRAVR